jgi:jumonji domain-containing protein 7
MYPLFRHAHPIQVEVEEGDLFYLPSLFYHHVQQRADNEGKVVAVNYWYDMAYNSNYYYFEFLRHQCRNLLID